MMPHRLLKVQHLLSTGGLPARQRPPPQYISIHPQKHRSNAARIIGAESCVPRRPGGLCLLLSRKSCRRVHHIIFAGVGVKASTLLGKTRRRATAAPPRTRGRSFAQRMRPLVIKCRKGRATNL